MQVKRVIVLFGIVKTICKPCELQPFLKARGGKLDSSDGPVVIHILSTQELRTGQKILVYLSCSELW